ncbi:4694387b-5c2e-410e-8096-87984d3615cd [Thermothielavioides terrestris]|uniref:4694387b-5c2e-410e-8096-87984d3615cd n=1 Tax=Thermothielavioides terrestris TaxID=2587410 RepID=A0A3S4ARJ9_9PEZI|nr:4694387b-5c2e-410e-8096-87984d3615cd [Thermothielavioides terrestris]
MDFWRWGSSGAQAILGVVASGLVFYLFRVYWRLRHIPGPFWAKFSDVQRVLWVTTRNAHVFHQRAHERYGDAVRFGPNMSNFYRTLMPYTRSGGALPAVFNTRDEELHKKIKSPIAPLFSLSNTLRLEPFVDRTIDVMTAQIDRRFADKDVTFDLANWLQFFAFEVMGTLTFSKRYGFLEEGRDINNMLSTIWDYMSTAAPYTQIPWFDEFWNKTALMTSIKGKTTGMGILGYVGRFIAERKEAQAAGGKNGDGPGDRDMLSQFMELTEKNPSLPPWAVTAWTFSNVIAGSDSTAAVMKEVMYNLLAHPDTLKRLRAELLESGPLSKPYPSWKDICDLPYLDACVQEGVRLHPPFCLPLERVVPEGGIMIGGRFYPGGTVVGMSPHVINRHKPTFGEDADVWNPDRWMVSKELRKKREDAILTFGSGRRVCLGRHIAMLELKKIVSALILRYDFDLVDPKRYWKENGWFFRQGGIDVTVKKRVEA